MKNRLNPSLFQFDYYLLKNLQKVIELNSSKIKNHKILDFGCGDMPYSTLFEHGGNSYLGADISGTCAELEFSINKRLDLSDESFDTIVSFQVLEHVENVSWYLNEANRLLNVDGNLILSTHGFWFYHPHPEDFRRWTKYGLCYDIERHGFEVVDQKSLVGPLAWTLIFQVGGACSVFDKIPLIGKFISSLICLIMNLFLPLADKITPSNWLEENASIYFVVAKKSNKPH